MPNSTIGRTAKRLEILRTKRQLQKTGSRDKTQTWSRVRLAICSQFQEQLALAKKTAAVQRRAEFPALHLDGMFFCDEHAEACVLGGAGHHGQGGSHEYRAPKDKDGVYLPPSKGGTYADPQPTTKPKFDSKVLRLFGVAPPTRDGKRQRSRPLRT